jgi:uncharacterized UPF0146 family protein
LLAAALAAATFPACAQVVCLGAGNTAEIVDRLKARQIAVVMLDNQMLAH